MESSLPSMVKKKSTHFIKQRNQNLLIPFSFFTMKIKPITLQIEKDLWERFKEHVPRTERLNDALIKLIKKEVKNEHH